MPNYAFKCDKCGHTFDRVLPLSKFDYAQTCPECGAVVRMLITAPAIQTSEGARAAFDERVYRQHNVTRPQTSHYEHGGTIKAEPVRDGLQCQCGNCGAHRKRNAVSGVAAPGKAV